jgi:hypothetical protein
VLHVMQQGCVYALSQQQQGSSNTTHDSLLGAAALWKTPPLAPHPVALLGDHTPPSPPASPSHPASRPHSQWLRDQSATGCSSCSAVFKAATEPSVSTTTTTLDPSSYAMADMLTAGAPPVAAAAAPPLLLWLPLLPLLRAVTSDGPPGANCCCCCGVGGARGVTAPAAAAPAPAAGARPTAAGADAAELRCGPWGALLPPQRSSTSSSRGDTSSALTCSTHPATPRCPCQRQAGHTAQHSTAQHSTAQHSMLVWHKCMGVACVWRSAHKRLVLASDWC